MISCQCHFFSKALKSHVGVQVLLPAMFDNDTLFSSYEEVYLPRRFPVLYLLHGALEDETSWLRMTNIERYAQRHSVAVVMPRGENSFYVNAKYGADTLDFITEELPRMIGYTFPALLDPETTYIAGCSMGGYGAVRAALGKPGRYRAFGCLSGAVDPPRLEPLMTSMGYDFFRYDLLFGGVQNLPGTENDLFALARTYPDAAKPQAFFYCGSEDSNNLAMNQSLAACLRDHGFDVSLSISPGAHDWAYWDGAIEDFLGRIAEKESDESLIK